METSRRSRADVIRFPARERASREQRPSQPTISVIVPALNEARNLERVLPDLPASFEVIVIDGGSTDDTYETVARVRPDAVFVSQSRAGKGNALACGFRRARGDIIVMFDADGSARAEEIPDFVRALVAGADFAKGSRALPGGGSEDITTLRRLGNRVLTGVANRLFGARYTDLCYGYNAFWADVVDRLQLPAETPIASEMHWGDGFEIETLLNCRIAACGLDVREVPSFELNRLHGASNLHAFHDGLRVLRTLVAERRRLRTAATAVTAPPRLTRLTRRAS